MPMTDKVVLLPDPDDIEATSGRYVVPPAPEPAIFSEIGRKPIWWRDDFGRAHACEGAEMESGELVMWTLCQRGVDPEATFAPKPNDHLTCEGCIAVARDRQQRQSFENAVGRPLPPPANDT
jgi:hypothetical protein